LTPDVVVEFDREWALVLEEAKQSQDLAGVQDLLAKWRHFAYRSNPDGAVRWLYFGPASAGQAIYLVVEDVQEVHVLDV
jgi:hypothetical protein